MMPAEAMRDAIATRSQRISSLLRAADLVMSESGEPCARTRATIALALINCAQDYASDISTDADKLERYLIPA